MKRTGPRPENLEAWMLRSAPTGAAAAAVGPIARRIHGSTAVIRRCCGVIAFFPVRERVWISHQHRAIQTRSFIT